MVVIVLLTKNISGINKNNKNMDLEQALKNKLVSYIQNYENVHNRIITAVD